MDPGETPSQPRHRDDAPDAAGRRIEQWILPFFTDSTLWPVLLVMAGVLATIGAAVLLLAVGDRNAFAIAALLLMLGMSGEQLYRDLRRGRLGLAGASIACLWLLIGLVAALLVRTGLF